MGVLRIVILTLLFCGSAGDLLSLDTVTINVRQSDDAIRHQLLQLTPLGTTARQVFQFLQIRLHHDRDSHITGGPGQSFRSTMSVDLGDYVSFTPQSYFIFPTVVQAFWYFDKDDKLRDIQVRRFVRGW
jgi:hypothetical protein